MWLTRVIRYIKKHIFKEAKASLQCKVRQMKNNWWSEISTEMQNAYDRKDSKALYKLVRQVFGPQRSTVAPMKPKDGSVLIKKDSFTHKLHSTRPPE